MKIFSHWPAKAAALIVAVMIVILNRNINQGSYYFSVPLTAVFHSAMLPIDNYPNAVSVSLRGNKEDLEGILSSMFKATADFSRYDRRGRYEATIDIQRLGPALRINPIEVVVEPRVLALDLESKSEKIVPIKITTTGFPPAGYEVVSTQVLPETILVEGPSSRIRVLELVETEEVLLQNQTSSFSSQVRLRSVDPSIRFPRGEFVEFRASIEERDVLNTFESINIIVLDLSPSLELASALPDGVIRVQGSVQNLERVSADDIQFIINAQNITRPGRYEVVPQASVPSNITVLQYEPEAVILEIREKEQ